MEGRWRTSYRNHPGCLYIAELGEVYETEDSVATASLGTENYSPAAAESSPTSPSSGSPRRPVCPYRLHGTFSARKEAKNIAKDPMSASIVAHGTRPMRLPAHIASPSCRKKSDSA